MDLQELCESIDLVDFFSQYTELEQKGREWWGLTPFQDENTPSFSVDPENHIYYCFSTGNGGTVLDFIMAYHHCSFREAVEKLKVYCNKEGISLTENKRLVTTSICKKFRERANKGKQSTAKVLPDTYMDKYIANVNLDVWLNEGISKEVLDMYQVRYDPFANRLVYPIRNLKGEIVNIGGRTLDPDWKAKKLKKYNYYQSWGVINVVFGLYHNKQEVIKTRNLILFEGAKSVMLANTWGINNCGAILTSHLGNSQMKLLLEFCVKNSVSLTFALDKEIDIRKDNHIAQLKKYLNIFYLWDRDDDLPDVKMAPVDMGEDIFRKLLQQRVRL